MNEKNTVEISAKWVRRVNSPLFWIVSALTGVSITFAPAYLYQCGQGRFENPSWWFVPVCFAAIYLVPLFYMRLATEIIVSIRAQHTRQRDDRLPRLMNRFGRLLRLMRFRR